MANKIKKEELLQSYLFILPAAIILLVFFLFPIGYAFVLSFLKLNSKFAVKAVVGAQNYTDVLSDRKLIAAFFNTLKYVAIVVPIQTFLAMLIASVLNSNIKGKNTFRIIYFLPTLTSSSALTLIFMFMFNQEGLINMFLKVFGVQGKNWLDDVDFVLKVIMAMNIWSTVPFFMTIYLAGLQDVPATQYEAASIDGANAWQRFLYITVPNLRPITAFVVIMGLIGCFQVFDQAYIVSKGTGGPGTATLTLVLLIYQYAFAGKPNMGRATALAFILALFIMGVTYLAKRFSKEESLY